MKKRSIAGRIFKLLGIALGAVALCAVALIAWLTVCEYRPDAVETLDVLGGSGDILSPGETVSILSFNTGYAGLGREEDFFMDGGHMTRPDKRSDVTSYLNGIIDSIAGIDPDICLLQETDVHSTRSYGINEVRLISSGFGGCAAFAHNYKCPFVPFPLPPIGRVESGLLTLSRYDVEEADRVALPVPFKWPVRAANLKRCLLVERLPLSDGSELVLVNLHLEAYDDGSGKLAQARMLIDILTEEYEKGNYVVAGGDFNQSFASAGADYPMLSEDYWMPSEFPEELLPEGWQTAFDASAPSCRLLNKPYSGDRSDTQFYLIDGFILSPNVTLGQVKTLDLDFQYADHNPVYLEITLGQQEAQP